MRQRTGRIRIATRGQGFTDVTARLQAFVAESKISEGLLTIWCRHTSASLLVQENADPDVRADLLDFFRRIAPESGPYRHDAEGPDDMPAHIRAALTPVQLSVPIMDGRLSLGTWQAIYLCEHRRSPHERELALHVLGE
jgi:secondary thiamine-phosphate synthase enzyme